jgi:hypothetical protein
MEPLKQMQESENWRNQIKSTGGEEASRECPYRHNRRIWNDGLRRNKKYGSVQWFICRDCDNRFSESIVEIDITKKVGERLHSGENNHEVGVTSGDASYEKVYNNLSFASGEDVSSHELTIVEKSLYGLPFSNSKH